MASCSSVCRVPFMPHCLPKREPKASALISCASPSFLSNCKPRFVETPWSQSIMKAAFYDALGPPEIIRFGELPTPEPQAGEARVKVAVAGLNPIDTYIRSGA